MDLVTSTQFPCFRKCSGTIGGGRKIVRLATFTRYISKTVLNNRKNLFDSNSAHLILQNIKGQFCISVLL